ncbi:MAG: RelA/SpoT family protein [Gammaproteobacteria bacterium]
MIKSPALGEHHSLSRFTAAEIQQIQTASDIVSPFEPLPKRPSGRDVAEILMQFPVDLETVLAAILSDPRIRNNQNAQHQIKAHFSPTVVKLVDDINWLNTLNVYSLDMANQPTQAETLRRMLLSMTRDVRAVLIKLAYRLHRLRILPQEDYDMRRFIARETLDIYAPIANRLGLGQLKWELEDMAFRYLEPQIYRQVAKSLADNRVQRESCINNFIRALETLLASENIQAKIYGRPKHIYSIWKKMQRKQLDIDNLYDLLAVRVVVDKISTCYGILGIVHSRWQYIPKEFDDYIANPKENGYQSLHTVVTDSSGNRIEIQIRTHEMHEFAEHGVAAHWLYKEGGQQDHALARGIVSLRQLLEVKEGDTALLENFHTEFFSDRVYTLTPGGRLIELLKGSTPLDFAYAVHTEIGHRCRGAKVDGRIVPLSYHLRSGERVEILTTKHGKPNRNWLDPSLGYLKTPRAVAKVKEWFKQQEYEQNIASGKRILEKEALKLGIENVDAETLATNFHYPDVQKLLIAIGRGDVTTRQIAAALHIPTAAVPQFIPIAKKTPKSDNSISVAGMENVLTHFAQCCAPIPGDDIVGFISKTKGIIIHRRDCSNILHFKPNQLTRLIEVSWGKKELKLAVPIVVQAFDRQGLISDVTQVLAQSKTNILDAHFHTHDNFSASLELLIQVKDTVQLSEVLGKIGALPNVTEAKRKA